MKKILIAAILFVFIGCKEDKKEVKVDPLTASLDSLLVKVKITGKRIDSLAALIREDTKKWEQINKK